MEGVTKLHATHCPMVSHFLWSDWLTTEILEYKKNFIFEPRRTKGPLNTYSFPLYQTISVMLYEESFKATWWTMIHAVTFLVEWPVYHWDFSEQLILFLFLSPCRKRWPLLSSFVPTYVCLVSWRGVEGLHAGLCPKESHSIWIEKFSFESLANNSSFLCVPASTGALKPLLTHFYEHVLVSWRVSKDYTDPFYEHVLALVHEGDHRTTCCTVSHGVTFPVEWLLKCQSRIEILIFQSQPCTPNQPLCIKIFLYFIMNGGGCMLNYVQWWHLACGLTSWQLKF